MDKPKIFYEDNKVGKKRLTIFAAVLSMWDVMWTLGLIFSFVIPMPEGFSQNNFQDNLVDNIVIIVFIVLLLAVVIALFIYRAKSQRFKYALTITEDELKFAVPINGKYKFMSKEFVSYEIVDKLNKYATIKLVFTQDVEIVIRTRLYDELKTALDYLIKINSKRQQTW